MIVQCISFGSLWWLRPGNDNSSAEKYASNAAVFNTTGFQAGSKKHRNWIVAGLIRFNAGTCLIQGMDLNNITPGKFFTSGLEHRGVENRLLLSRRMSATAVPDMLIVAVSSKEHGRIRFDKEWRTSGVKVVSASSFKNEQESLLMLPANGAVLLGTEVWSCNQNGAMMGLAKME